MPKKQSLKKDENVAQEPAQLLAETWCPYLLWVLRNLPHKFEKLAHVTKSAKKNVTIWASRSTRAPKTSPYGHLAPLVPQKLNANNKAPRFARRLKNREQLFDEMNKSKTAAQNQKSPKRGLSKSMFTL